MVGELLAMSEGPLELLLCPGVGGSIARFDRVRDGCRLPVLRGCEGVSASVLAAGSFPLVPYVNRIRGGCFEFRGRTVRIKPNMASDLSPLHGEGWLGAWNVISNVPGEVVLGFAGGGGEWPWAYQATQRFKLMADALEIELSCRNMSSEPMPCGLGQHPYFPCGGLTRIATAVEHVWTINEHVLPIERIPAAGRFDLADRAVCGLGLDHGFGGWGGSATLTDPDWPFAITLSSGDADFFQLYSPESGGICVIEPVSHANAALNAPEDEWSELGMRVLAPGEEMTLAMRIEISETDKRG